MPSSLWRFTKATTVGTKKGDIRPKTSSSLNFIKRGGPLQLPVCILHPGSSHWLLSGFTHSCCSAFNHPIIRNLLFCDSWMCWELDRISAWGSSHYTSSYCLSTAHMTPKNSVLSSKGLTVLQVSGLVINL